MKKLYTTISISLFLASFGCAQSNVILFSDGGEKFIASINGKIFNEEPQTRVECSGLMGEGQRISIDFEDEGIADIQKNFMTESGMQYTVTIKKNKKGAYVLRPMDMGIPLAQVEKSPTPDPSKFEDAEIVETNTTTVNTDRTEAVGTTVQITETSSTTTTGEKVDVGISMGGVDFNMNVNVDDDMGAAQTTTTTTTTTTTSSSSTSGTAQVFENAEVAPVASDDYVLPGYSGPIGCPDPMSDSEYAEAKSSISSKSFSDSKMTLAKQVGSSKCFLTDQVKGIMEEFEFEDDKLEFAKYAYDRTYDIGNYYKVNDAFTFEMTIDELNEFIEGR